jgi:hypothetical protein
MRDAKGRFRRDPDEPFRLEPKEITDLAREIVTNVVYIANDKNMDLSFPILLWLTPKWSEAYMAKVGALWEKWSAASRTSINGRPMFFSCHVLHVDDLDPLLDEVKRLQKALA